MIKFGASMLSWISEWTLEGGKYAIAQTAKCGFDLIEISLPPVMSIEPDKIKKELWNAGIEARFTMILPKEYHLPLYPDKALELLKSGVDLVELMEGKFLGGVLYSAIGTFSGNPVTEGEKGIIEEVFSEISAYAGLKGIVLAVEPINRYETYLFNSSKQVIDFCNKIKAPNLFLMMDTFHMNMEEKGFYDPVITAGNALKYMHISESNRGMPGDGNVHWDNLFRGLSEIDFQGDLVLENFSSFVPGLATATSLWQPSKYNAAELATGGLQFMKSMALKWNLN